MKNLFWFKSLSFIRSTIKHTSVNRYNQSTLPETTGDFVLHLSPLIHHLMLLSKHLVLVFNYFNINHIIYLWWLNIYLWLIIIIQKFKTPQKNWILSTGTFGCYWSLPMALFWGALAIYRATPQLYIDGLALKDEQIVTMIQLQNAARTYIKWLKY